MQKMQIRLTVMTAVAMVLLNLSHPCCAQEIDDEPGRPRNEETNEYAESNCPECEIFDRKNCVPDPRKQLPPNTPSTGTECCGGNPVPVGFMCCEGQIYDPRTQSCCSGKVTTKIECTECEECRPLENGQATCVPKTDGTLCESGVCCSGKCISETDLCVCGSSVEINKIHLSKSSCGMSDDEVDLTKFAVENIINKLARTIGRSAARTASAARTITTAKLLITVYARFDYRCCENIANACCKWQNKTKKVPLNGPVLGCYIFRLRDSFYHEVANSIKEEMSYLCL